MTDTRSHAGRTFLRGPDVERKAKEMLLEADRVWVAVAYWGGGSLDRFDFKSIRDKRKRRHLNPDGITIVCDLMSGACNPTEIRHLQNALGKSHVLMRDQLHAKVWWTENGAIIGSSNISANGLGFEGNELKGTIEANVFVDDGETLAAIDRWFDKDVAEGAKEITNADFREAHRRWKRHRTTRPEPSRHRSLLDSIRLDSSSLANRGVNVWVYRHDDFSPWASKAIKSEQTARRDNSIDGWQNVDRPIPPPGAYVLDFDLEQDGAAKLDGLYQVLQDNPLRKIRGNNVLLCKPVTKIEGLRLGNQKLWERAASAAAKSKPHRDGWAIEEFGKRFLGAAE